MSYNHADATNTSNPSTLQAVTRDTLTRAHDAGLLQRGDPTHADILYPTSKPRSGSHTRPSKVRKALQIPTIITMLMAILYHFQQKYIMK